MNTLNRSFPLFLGLGSLLHLLTDAICFFILFNANSSGKYSSQNIYIYFAVYTFLAFATQFVWGYFSDKYNLEKILIFSGSLLLFFALLLINLRIEICIVMMGLGNSLIHVGTGSKVLQTYPNKFTPIGILVAPGAIGVTTGTLAGKAGIPYFWLLGFLLLAICVGFLSKWPENLPVKENIVKPVIKRSGIIYSSILISAVIVVRSFIGSNIIFSWKTDIILLWVLTLVIAAGKALGGMTADKYGWFKTGALGLLLSIPGIIFFADTAWAGLVGILLFNLTMPITVFLLYRLMSGRPAFSFGLSCLALYLGFIPAYFLPAGLLTSQITLTILILLSVLALYFAYKLYFNK